MVKIHIRLSLYRAQKYEIKVLALREMKDQPNLETLLRGQTAASVEGVFLMLGVTSW